jgi:hypothetical protein
MVEHHFQPDATETIPNRLMMATHLCGVTRNLRIGCGFNIVPVWHRCGWPRITRWPKF